MDIKEFSEKFIKAEGVAFAEGKFEALKKLEDPNIVFHLYALDQELKGFEAHKQYIAALKQACPGIFPDWRYITGDGNLFTLLLKMSGVKFTDQAPGFPPPTGKEINVSSLWVLRVANGKITEGWSNGVIKGLE